MDTLFLSRTGALRRRREEEDGGDVPRLNQRGVAPCLISECDFIQNVFLKLFIWLKIILSSKTGLLFSIVSPYRLSEWDFIQFAHFKYFIWFKVLCMFVFTV